jgi:hypothetical protein
MISLISKGNRRSGDGGVVKSAIIKSLCHLEPERPKIQIVVESMSVMPINSMRNQLDAT